MKTYTLKELNTRPFPIEIQNIYEKFAKVEAMIKSYDKHITELRKYPSQGVAISVLQELKKELSQSNPNGEILSDTRNTTVESKPLTKGGSLQPMPHRPDVDKALGNDTLIHYKSWNGIYSSCRIDVRYNSFSANKSLVTCPECLKLNGVDLNGK